MNPAANAAVSGGLSGAIVVIVNWIMSMIPHLGAMPSDVQIAFGIVITAAGGYFFHMRGMPKLVAGVTPITADSASPLTPATPTAPAQ